MSPGLRIVTRLAGIVLLASLGTTATLVCAIPFIPADDAQVLERLPEKSSPELRQLKVLRAAVARDPRDIAQVSLLARRYVEAARSEGDPRYLGYAQAALAPWWNDPNAPTPAIVLRATIRQSNHEFDAALADLDTVIGRDPRAAQARLTRATVLTVQGKYREAREDCGALEGVVPEIYVVICTAAIDGSTGKARPAIEAVARALAAPSRADAGVHEWGETLLAEMSHRLGDKAAAERHFRAALSLDGKDPYLIGAYSDFLLDEMRAAEILPLIPPDTRIDPLLLRRALALHAMGSPDATATTDAVRARIAASRARGDTVHLREESRFELSLNGAPGAALELANRDWKIQKEPADLRVLADAAAATGDAAALQVVRRWLDETGLEYVAAREALVPAAPKKTP